MKEKKIPKRWVVFLGASMSFMLMLTSAESAPETIKIGGIYSLTGPDSNLGSQVEVGYDMGIEDINKSGGVYVKDLNKKLPLELVTLDMESSSEKAVSRAETAFSKHNVIAYVGTTYIAAARVNAEKNKVPMIPVACADQTVFEQGFKY
jgi:branched-chain amino acid transport system substrate-binding protein